MSGVLVINFGALTFLCLLFVFHKFLNPNQHFKVKKLSCVQKRSVGCRLMINTAPLVCSRSGLVTGT
jgi:hypothetical protein